MGRRDWDAGTLAAAVRAGDRRALARAITLVESRDPLAYEVVRELYPDTGSAYAVGLTGPPGVGKSTLVGALLRELRARELSVGVLSVDPTSPFTHGALLGDRIRLADHFLDPEVFIRSMGTRGHLGGLSEATLQSLLVLDAAGKDVLLVETVGIGQSEVGVLGSVDTVVLVLMPGSGDAIQALKAGVLEIPDVIVVNKRSHPAAKTLVQELRAMLPLVRGEWRIPIVLTEATQQEGVDELWSAVEQHRAHLEESGALQERRRERLASEVFALASARAKTHLERAVEGSPELRQVLAEVEERRLDPLSAVDAVLERVFKIDGRDARAS